MSAPHFFAGAPEPGETLVLDGDDAHHAVRALRLRPGEELTSSDGAGALVRCEVRLADRARVEAEVLERDVAPRPRPELTVMLAAPKGERLSWGIQKLTELGTDAIVVLETDRSVRRWEGERAERLAERLGAVAREAAKQSRRRFLPRVEGPLGWDEALARALAAGPAFVLWEAATEGLTRLLPKDLPAALSLLIGPEGGIPERDARAAEAAGARLASLGPTILRTETAAVAAAVVALAASGRLG